MPRLAGDRAWSISERPSITVPSAAEHSPGRSSTMSPARVAAAGTFTEISSGPTNFVAVSSPERAGEIAGDRAGTPPHARPRKAFIGKAQRNIAARRQQRTAGAPMPARRRGHTPNARGTRWRCQYVWAPKMPGQALNAPAVSTNHCRRHGMSAKSDRSR